MARVPGKERMFSKLSSQAHEIAGRLPEEGELTRRIEQQTAKIPSLGFFGLAVGSMVGSAVLAVVAERKEWANFVGMWAPSLLLIGIYNKLVKIEAELVESRGEFRTQQRSQQRPGYAGESVSGQGLGQEVTGQGVTGESATMNW